MSLIIAVLFIVFGFLLMKYPPKNINGMYGYRTSMSMKNQDTWEISQKHSGFSMLVIGVINGIFGSWSIIQPMGINNEVAQLLFLLISAIALIIIEEMHLMKLFNKDGSRKNKINSNGNIL